jgi:uncharacterized protein (TIGR03437 family)
MSTARCLLTLSLLRPLIWSDSRLGSRQVPSGRLSNRPPRRKDHLPIFTGWPLYLVLALAAPFANAETATVRSGNGPVGGKDSSVTFLQGPFTGDFNHSFTSADFSNAQSAPAAFIVSPNPLWISTLSEDASAKWIGTNPDAASSGNTALYAVSFKIAGTFGSATLALHYASDDTPSFLGGIFLNGTVICQDSIEVGFSQEHALTCNVGPLLQVGTNWLYFDIVNVGGAAGLLFSAAITTVGSVVPFINAGGVVNAASYTAPVAPGSIAAVFGNFLVNSLSSATGFPLPTSLSRVSLQFAPVVPVPLIFVSGGEAAIQVPWEAGQPQAVMSALVNGTVSAPQAVNLAPFAPGIFSMNAQGSGQGAILDKQYRLVDSSNPATAGDVIQIYCTGLGAVTNQPLTGSPASSNPLSVTTTNPMVTIGDTLGRVFFSGLAPDSAGLYQVNVEVPALRRNATSEV